jgi:hypothetical protein
MKRIFFYQYAFFDMGTTYSYVVLCLNFSFYEWAYWNIKQPNLSFVYETYFIL